ncbi:MAG: hypothetical protein Q7J25_12200, partial [Vicinamibacterales bacterium]|nr:hypothetical protein [Vicinamibacterales bacterium]
RRGPRHPVRQRRSPRCGPAAQAVCAALVLAGLIASGRSAAAQAPAGPGTATPGTTAPAATAQTTGVASQVALLGDFDYGKRTAAAQAVRRAPTTQAADALAAAVTTSADSYVRFRAFVLLTGLLDRRLEDFARAALTDRNDRLRQAAYDWLAASPLPALAPRLIDVLETEQAEFVRPSLLRALAALDADPRVRTALVRETSRGLDIFRGAVIEALGLRGATYAVDALAGVVAIDGPLRDVAALALGRIGGAQAATVLAMVHDKDKGVELTLRTAQCLADGQCDTVRGELVKAWPSSAATGIAGSAAQALSVMAERGDARAMALLVEAGIAGVRDLRDHAAVALSTVALRTPRTVLAWMVANPGARDGVIALLKDGFDLIEEDVAEETFYATARATYWKAGEGSDLRAAAALLIDGLAF